MGLRLTTAPTTLAIDLPTAKNWLRVEDAEEDGSITALIKIVTREVERRLDAQLINATWTLTLDSFSSESGQYNLDHYFLGDIILIPKWPLSSVTSIAYLDADGDSQTHSASLYDVDTANIPGRIKPAFGQIWPTVRSDVLETVTITLVAGYGASQASVPDDLQAAMLMLLTHRYENREAVITGTIASEMPMGVSDILDDYALPLLF